MESQRDELKEITEEDQMSQLINKLKSIPRSYPEFVEGIVDYAKAKEEHLTLVMEYLSSNESDTSSDVIRFISLQLDFYEDSVPEDVDND